MHTNPKPSAHPAAKRLRSSLATGVIGVVVLAATGLATTGCAGNLVHSYRSFQSALDRGASCSELYDQRARFDDADSSRRSTATWPGLDAHRPTPPGTIDDSTLDAFQRSARSGPGSERSARPPSLRLRRKPIRHCTVVPPDRHNCRVLALTRRPTRHQLRGAGWGAVGQYWTRPVDPGNAPGFRRARMTTTAAHSKGLSALERRRTRFVR
jgi:hypothetical protein